MNVPLCDKVVTSCFSEKVFERASTPPLEAMAFAFIRAKTFPSIVTAWSTECGGFANLRLTFRSLLARVRLDKSGRHHKNSLKNQKSTAAHHLTGDADTAKSVEKCKIPKELADFLKRMPLPREEGWLRH
jgi:hypothetical protein